MEELSIYDCWFVYIKGKDNTLADTLSCYPAVEVCEQNEMANTKARHPYRSHDNAAPHVVWSTSKKSTPV